MRVVPSSRGRNRLPKTASIGVIATTTDILYYFEILLCLDKGNGMFVRKDPLRRQRISL